MNSMKKQYRLSVKLVSSDSHDTIFDDTSEEHYEIYLDDCSYHNSSVQAYPIEGLLTVINTITIYDYQRKGREAYSVQAKNNIITIKEKTVSQEEYINSLVERQTHSDTMRALTPLEQEHLKDWKEHFENIQHKESD